MARFVFVANIATATLAFCSYMIISPFLNGALLSHYPPRSDEFAWVRRRSTKAKYGYTYEYTGTPKEVNKLCWDSWQGSLCQRMIPGDNWTIAPVVAAATLPLTLVNITMNCQDMFRSSGLGTGNHMSAFYGLRMAAAAMGNVDVRIACHDADAVKGDLILPWMTGYFPRTMHTVVPTARIHPTIPEACSGVPIGYRWKDMQYELRRMAIAMVGIPNPEHPAAAWAEEHMWSSNIANNNAGAVYQLPTPKRHTPPIYSNVDLDEAVLHFRCGDLISSDHPRFGFMKFGAFSRHLHSNTKSIGIATQPFDEEGQSREEDGGSDNKEKCRRVVYALVDHLREKFPQARIAIRNDAKETIALTFARMIMAQQVVIGITTFGVFPGIATFGTGLVRYPDYVDVGPNQWLLNPNIETLVDNVKLIREPMLPASKCKSNWGQDGEWVLQWFKDYDMPA